MNRWILFSEEQKCIWPLSSTCAVMLLHLSSYYSPQACWVQVAILKFDSSLLKSQNVIWDDSYQSSNKTPLKVAILKLAWHKYVMLNWLKMAILKFAWVKLQNSQLQLAESGHSQVWLWVPLCVHNANIMWTLRFMERIIIHSRVFRYFLNLPVC